MSDSSKGYQFTFSGNTVVAVYEVERARVKLKRMDRDETWSLDGLDVTRIVTKFGKVQTSVYTDTNRDGVFQKTFEVEVLTGANPHALETYKFSLASGRAATGESVVEGDVITGVMELQRHGWKVDRIDANETFQVFKVNGDSLILRTKTEWSGKIDFSVFRDDDHDGLWTEIADGETFGTFVTPSGVVDLVGIVNAGLLQAADALIA
ncbi:MAG: hypothetical protein NZ694_03925 [Tepidimonas sp.]|nr:hypothetical protein [Tepidimonas sp.]